jgi:hypothetical protein
VAAGGAAGADRDGADPGRGGTQVLQDGQGPVQRCLGRLGRLAGFVAEGEGGLVGQPSSAQACAACSRWPSSCRRNGSRCLSHAIATWTRRGPGQPGSARRIPVGSCGPAGAFATGQPLDVAPGGGTLLGLAEYAAGQDDRFPGSTDDELTGIICALDRAEAAACALKHAAVTELIRRRPGTGCELTGPARMPVIWEEFTEQELADALAETRWAASGMLDLAQDLTVKLPGTYAAFRAGVLRQSKVEIIARAVAGLDPDEAQAAEAKVLDRAGRLTPGGPRSGTPSWRSPRTRPPNGAKTPSGRPGWNAGPSTPATPTWPAANCPPPTCSPPTRGSPGGRRS